MRLAVFPELERARVRIELHCQHLPEVNRASATRVGPTGAGACGEEKVVATLGFENRARLGVDTVRLIEPPRLMWAEEPPLVSILDDTEKDHRAGPAASYLRHGE
jgi:hypothetical protein